MRALVFDLDDTLYVEYEYFRSGYTFVAAELAKVTGHNAADLLEIFESIHLEDGRDYVFDKALARLELPDSMVPHLVSTYRSHTPSLSLPNGSGEVLNRLRKRFKLGCVTDGWAAVQRGKVAALELEPFLDAIVIADDAGRAFWKPHPISLRHCCEKLGVSTHEAIFVGDNPARDMEAARAAEMRFILMRTPLGHKWTYPKNEPMIFAIVASLSELEELLDNMVREGHFS